ncbi:MAG: CAP domain-containing protein [Alphaproteobacteria bacterium]|nr:CAP domain-containing protein [Alphaproteobacteria bacterium]MBL6938366.1 CAP domain-containing protein [Alphaproteobacteria bacterium]MBL7096425.1 CAP domain-containing protein [Alphaproteobacteria bacterium]
MRPVIAAFLLLLLAGCATTQPPAPRPPPPDPRTLMSALEQRIAILIADQRSRIDPEAKPLMIDPELVDIARQRSSDMATKHYFAHAAPNGDTSASILMAEDTRFQGLLGENIAAQHYRAELGIDVDQFARSFVDIWLKSPKHKENLAYAEYNRTGIGAAVDGDTVYVTQLFATDLGLGPHLDAPADPVTPIRDNHAIVPKPKPEPGLRGPR